MGYTYLPRATPALVHYPPSSIMKQTHTLFAPKGIIMACLLVLLFISSCGVRRGRKGTSDDPREPLKRELRAAWLPTIFRSDYARRTREEVRELLTKRIELLKQTGCNVLIFQIRAEGDAWYPSELEPWSRYLTGAQGQAPEPSWDPLGFVINECHTRGIEVHAWMNPYRGAANADQVLDSKHPARRFPELYVRYGKQLVMDPGHPQSVRYITSIVRDVVDRYDVDAIHFDDYFYPYPKDGMRFEDEATFEKYGLRAGYYPEEKDRWRRDNVNRLISEVRKTILNLKPWVRFGVSPFGIYRNETSGPKGSRTSGLQTYDDLHADVLQWCDKGWIDYVIPQIYWNIGNPVADYYELVEWWGKQLRKSKVQLCIGQHAQRTMDSDQLTTKLALSRRNAEGNAWWSAEDILKNYKGLGDSLQTSYQRYRAFLPEYQGSLGATKAPLPVQDIMEDRNEDGHMLLWPDYRNPTDPEKPYYYAVYAFPDGVKVDITDPRHLVSISTNAYYLLPTARPGMKYTYAITAINRFWQESKPSKITIRY